MTKAMKYLNDVNYKDCVGKLCKSLNSGDFKILKYNGAKNVEIQFLKTGFKTSVQLINIKSGSIKDPYLPSVCGVGILGTKYPSKVNGRNTNEYMLWQNMLERCYSNTNICDSFKKKNPTYEGCEVSDKFKSYEYFYEWGHEQIGFDNEDWHLDKDLLVKGNKVYSESTCVFLPREINQLLIKCESLRGECLIGVSWHKRDKAFMARVSKNKGGSEWLGYFNTELEAFNAYKIAKEVFVKEQAEKYKSQIDPRAYEALMNYTVEITD